jgi:hypothetical protein
MESPLGPRGNENAKMTFVTVVFRDGSRRELDVTVEEAAKLRDSGTIPSERSDLSGAKVGEDEKDSVVVTFSNGAKRRLAVKTEETQELKAKGHAVRSISSSYYLVPKSLRLAVVTVFLGALLTPTISRQFTDRQQESELKSRLSEQIHLQSSRALYSADSAVHHLLPEFLAENDDCELYKTRRTEENRKQCEDAARKADRAALQKRIQTLDRWDLDFRATWFQLRVFEDPNLRQDWGDYYLAVFRFSQVSPGACGAGRDQTIKDIRAYLSRIDSGKYDKAIEDLGGDTKPCVQRKGQRPRSYPQGDARFLSAYDTVRDRLLHRSSEIAFAIDRAHTSRYSVGFRDFIDDLITPFGSD